MAASVAAAVASQHDDARRNSLDSKRMSIMANMVYDSLVGMLFVI